MLSQREFIRVSLEINLFFQRIMKEHLFFIETIYNQLKRIILQKAKLLKQQFENFWQIQYIMQTG